MLSLTPLREIPWVTHFVSSANGNQAASKVCYGVMFVLDSHRRGDQRLGVRVPKP